MNRWLNWTVGLIYVSIVSFVIFWLLGGSLHGDGGWVAMIFLCTGYLSTLATPVCFVLFLATAIRNKRRGKSFWYA
ncbi:hypothetical protein AB4Y89_05490 [Terriglobus sp. 2YAB30_2]|uniref:hypothetical protein n=1 Tax=unclassified Terriglobus TaxID=2628988 RepID=UPI003F962DB9